MSKFVTIFTLVALVCLAEIHLNDAAYTVGTAKPKVVELFETFNAVLKTHFDIENEIIQTHDTTVNMISISFKNGQYRTIDELKNAANNTFDVYEVRMKEAGYYRNNEETATHDTLWTALDNYQKFFKNDVDYPLMARVNLLKTNVGAPKNPQDPRSSASARF